VRQLNGCEPFHYSVAVSNTSPEGKECSPVDYRSRWEAVSTIRAQELAAMTEEQARRIIFALRLFVPVPPDPRNGMGLVEQQAIFHKDRR
jgi:hypothetical protein